MHSKLSVLVIVLLHTHKHTVHSFYFTRWKNKICFLGAAERTDNNLTLTQYNDNKVGNFVLVVCIEFAFLTWTTLLCIAKIVCSVKCSKHRENRIRHRICEFYFIICFALIMIKNVYEIQVVSISKLDKYECVGRFGYYYSFFFGLSWFSTKLIICSDNLSLAFYHRWTRFQSKTSNFLFALL